MASVVIGPVTDLLEACIERLTRGTVVNHRKVIDLDLCLVPGDVQVQLQGTDALPIELIVEGGMAVVPTLMEEEMRLLVVTVVRAFDLQLIETQAIV
jgi:hypothetical protein